MKKRLALRVLFYGIGTLLLAIGLTLNSKTGLGTAPIITMPFAISAILHVNFASMVFLFYVIMTCLQFWMRGKKRSWKIFLQFPFSMVFSVLLDFFGAAFDFYFAELWKNVLLLFVAMLCTAIGVSMMVNMKIITNPADGFAQTVGEVLQRGVGFGKNVVDLSFVVLTCLICFFFHDELVGVGIGTAISMIGVGRFIALFQHFFRRKMLSSVGLGEPK